MSTQAPTKTAVFSVPVREFEVMNRYPDGFWQRLQYSLWDQWDEDGFGFLTEQLTLKTKASDEEFRALVTITDVRANDSKTTWWFKISELDGQLVELYGVYVTGLHLPAIMGLGTIRTEPWAMQQ